jgi:ABC-type microcin C transport system permease subunit YejE
MIALLILSNLITVFVFSIYIGINDKLKDVSAARILYGWLISIFYPFTLAYITFICLIFYIKCLAEIILNFSKKYIGI